MAYKTCENCGSRIFEYGCVNCDEIEYISMQDEFEIVIIQMPKDQEDERSVATKMPNEQNAGKIKYKP